MPSCALFRHRPGPTLSFISVEETDVQVCGMSEVTGIFRGRTQTQCKPPKTGPWLIWVPVCTLMPGMVKGTG